MAADTSVKFYSSFDLGLPGPITAVADNVVSILDAVLQNGSTPVSVTSLTVSSGVATVVTATSHGFSQPFEIEIGKVIQISGADTVELNGEKRITVVDATTFTYETTSPDQTATGTITAKIAGAGWSKDYVGSSRAVYRNVNATNPVYLRIEDSNTGYTRCIGYETMSGIDTGTNPFPSTAQLSGGLYFRKYSSGTNNWFAIATNKTFYLFSQASTNFGYNFLGFGEYKRLNPTFAYNNFIGAQNSTTVTTQHSPWVTTTAAVTYFQRSSTGVVSKAWEPYLVGFQSGPTSIGLGCFAFPSADGKLIISKDLYAVEDSSNVILGIYPGTYFTRQVIGILGVFYGGFYPNYVPGFSGTGGTKDLLFIPLNYTTGTTLAFSAILDITGPWEY